MDSTQTTLGTAGDITPETRMYWTCAGELVHRLLCGSEQESIEPVITNLEEQALPGECDVSVEVRGVETPRELSAEPLEQLGCVVSFTALSHRAEDIIGEYTDLTVTVRLTEDVHSELVPTSAPAMAYTFRIRLYAPDVDPIDTSTRTIQQLMLPR